MVFPEEGRGPNQIDILWGRYIVWRFSEIRHSGCTHEAVIFDMIWI